MTAGGWSAVVTVAAVVPYLRAVLRGGVRPARTTWLIWTTLGVVSFAGQVGAGAGDSLWLTGAQTAATAAVFAAAVVRGHGGWDPVDRAALGVAVVGVAGWAVLGESAVAIAAVIVADGAGTAVTVRKAARWPGTELASAFVLQGAGGGLGLAAVGATDPALLAYPAYIVVANAAIVTAILLGRRRGNAGRNGAGPAPASGRA